MRRYLLIWKVIEDSIIFAGLSSIHSFSMQPRRGHDVGYGFFLRGGGGDQDWDSLPTRTPHDEHRRLMSLFSHRHRLARSQQRDHGLEREEDDDYMNHQQTTLHRKKNEDSSRPHPHLHFCLTDRSHLSVAITPVVKTFSNLLNSYVDPHSPLPLLAHVLTYPSRVHHPFAGARRSTAPGRSADSAFDH
ncbi:hypothetical protein ACRALDRAFT_207371 [Sodiomyces alcalophilus JCM 7366]|uniref:uncharacterized protein n=1 Tax=Sodiomyces alcalophilus JCM 7366 TaxID=591952 RepID=UPI0039B5882B